MYSATLLLSIVSLLIWVVLTFFRGGFWQLSAFDDDVLPHKELTSPPRVVAIVPARNEADAIAHTVESLAAQIYAGELRIYVVDDHSEDGTAEVVREAMRAERRATILQADSLPSGWTGKIWALAAGSGQSGYGSARLLLVY